MEYLTDEHYAIAEKNGIKRHTVYQRVNEYNWDVQRAITAPNQNKRDVRGWIKWKEEAEKHGVSRPTYYRRVEKGMSQEQAATEKPNRTQYKKERVM